LENVASFLGVGRVGYVLEQIGITDSEEINAKLNTLSHKKVYYYESDELVPDNLETFEKVFNGLKETYKFVLHSPPAATTALAPSAVAAPVEAPSPQRPTVGEGTLAPEPISAATTTPTT
jgi:hypothetical protein